MIDPPSPLALFSRFTDRQSKRGVIGVGITLIALSALLDYFLAARGIALPFYYLIPIFGLAWFAGWRTGAAAALVSAIAHLIIGLTFHSPVSVHIVGVIVFIIAAVIARLIHTARLMIGYYFRGDTWKAIYKPIRIGDRFIITPAWHRTDTSSQPPNNLTTQPPSPPAIELFMDPGMAFGSGSHPTTQMCLSLLDAYLKPGDRVLDVGCGSGILSIAAAKLGAAAVLGVDIEPEAVRAAQANAVLNNIADGIEFRLGSIETILNSQPQISNPQTPTSPSTLQPATCNLQFPLVVANLLASIIASLLAEGLAQTVAPSGVLILSGIRAEQSDDVIVAVHAAGLSVIEQRADRGWVALAVKPRE